MKNNNVVIHIYDSSNKLVITRWLEELVKELVAYSMPLNFSFEAIKCQCIIMRTNILKQMKIFQVEGEELIKKGISLEDFPNWKPIEEYGEIWKEEYENNNERLNRAVAETEGQIIIFNEKPIDARYHEVCGGSTENSENVNGNIILYLRKVLCKYCQESPNYKNFKDISINEIEGKLGVKFPFIEANDNGAIENMIYDITRDDTGRIAKLTIAGKEFEGKNVKDLLGLDSTKFSWQPQKIRFLMIGKGDGLGFCQWGANELAKEGKSAEYIIKYYYTGVELKKIAEKSINKPLLGKVLVIDPAHGGEQGEDHVSANGLREKDLNLDIALDLEEILTEMGAKVYLTRREDTYVPITERAKLTNKIKPNFFLTLHQNFMKNSNVSGTEIYFYRGDKEAKLLGQLLMEKMTEKLETINRGIKIAEFFLLREINVSGVHIEVAYLSSEIDEAKLMKKEFRHQVAEAISEALSLYYNFS
ncbi:N-acetylmuramoyl-L-alanine amidase [Alkaliphilus transvaalensis]|uniref:N-acetylmuramoyl-L-alanine amidase n=1 Tax=Alkaliphilus transvaalensis TaxID=114628 RepID=UPI0006878D2D|nr:N-acetylmuramoyl-L-alanine amidase [Alkaliphilus transvaalensis]